MATAVAEESMRRRGRGEQLGLGFAAPVDLKREREEVAVGLGVGASCRDSAMASVCSSTLERSSVRRRKAWSGPVGLRWAEMAQLGHLSYFFCFA